METLVKNQQPEVQVCHLPAGTKNINDLYLVIGDDLMNDKTYKALGRGDVIGCEPISISEMCQSERDLTFGVVILTNENRYTVAHPVAIINGFLHCRYLNPMAPNNGCLKVLIAEIEQLYAIRTVQRAVRN